SCSVEQATLFGILAHSMNEGICRQIAADPRPTLSEVGRLVDVGSDIVELVTLHRGIGSSSIKRRCFNQADAAPLGQAFWRYVRPILAAVLRDLNETVVCSNPDGVFLLWRFSDSVDGVVVLNAGVVLRDGTAG